VAFVCIPKEDGVIPPEEMRAYVAASRNSTDVSDEEVEKAFSLVGKNASEVGSGISYSEFLAGIDNADEAGFGKLSAGCAWNDDACYDEKPKLMRNAQGTRSIYHFACIPKYWKYWMNIRQAH
jgi:hypothetical protein